MWSSKSASVSEDIVQVCHKGQADPELGRFVFRERVDSAVVKNNRGRQRSIRTKMGRSLLVSIPCRLPLPLEAASSAGFAAGYIAHNLERQRVRYQNIQTKALSVHFLRFRHGDAGAKDDRTRQRCARSSVTCFALRAVDFFRDSTRFRTSGRTRPRPRAPGPGTRRRPRARRSVVRTRTGAVRVRLPKFWVPANRFREPARP